jgi:hypothetical protein
MPQLQDPDPYRETGHGLLIVENLSTTSGVFVLEGWSGKVVWAEVI